MTLKKDKAILEFVDSLDLQSRGWMVVDHWEGDLCAVGVAAASDPRRLVYVSTYDRDPGRYDYQCEAPTGDLPEDYSTEATGENVDYDELVKRMEAHLTG